MTRRQLSEAWRTADGQAIAASAVVLVLGAIIVRLLTDRTGSGTPITALLVITVIIYALVSGRLSEFSAPGGWRAKFSEAADRPVTLSSLVIGATSLELHEIPKADFAAVKAHLDAEAGDDNPIVSMMELGYAGYDTENFRVILEYFATRRNFKAIVIVDKQRRLVAYIPAGQAASLVGATLPDFRKQFVEAVSTGSMAPSWDPELMTDASVKLGASYADALAAMDNRSLPCIAVVDDKGRFLGIMERDHIANSLLLALARAAGSRPTHSSAAGAL